MSNILRVAKLNESLESKWDEFVANSFNGTIFHRLSFLDYHGDRFAEKTNNIVWFKGEAIFALMPMCVFETNGKKIARSPFGASFGGPVYKTRLSLKYAMDMVKGLLNYCGELGISELELTLSPHYYQKEMDQCLEFALLSNGFELQSAELMNVVPLSNKEAVWKENLSGRARTSIRKIEEQFTIKRDVTINEFYPILQEDKARHNGAVPTHTYDELVRLKESFPNEIFADVAIHTNGGRAGICYFKPNKKVLLTFYMSQDDLGKGLDGKSLLIYEGMKDAVSKGIKFFDFGSSTVGYDIKNHGIANFKESFGARTYLKNKYSYSIR